MGGLRKFMPITFWTFMIGTLRPGRHLPVAGFWSKDEILASAGAERRTYAVLVVRPPRRLHDRGLHDPAVWLDLLRRVPRPRTTRTSRRRSSPSR